MSKESELRRSGSSGSSGGNLPDDVLKYLITCPDDCVQRTSMEPDNDKREAKAGAMVVQDFCHDSDAPPSPICATTGSSIGSTQRKAPPPLQVSIASLGPRRVPRAGASVGAYQVFPVLPDSTGVGIALEDDDSCGDVQEGEDAINININIAVAELVNEGETEAARKEIERLKKELQDLKQEQQSPELVLAEPVCMQPALSLFSHACEEEKAQKLEETNTKMLPFDRVSQELHGRETQLAVLQGAFDKFVSASAQDKKQQQLVLIGGESGSGKSVLAQKMQEFSPQGFYITGKFDHEGGGDTAVVPYSAIAQASEMLCETLLQQQQEQNRAKLVNQIHRVHHQCLDTQDLELLMTLMPSLHKVVGRDSSLSSSNAVNGNYLELKHRFQYAFQKFIGMVGSLAPLVMELEDLHWVDQASLELIQSLLKTDDETAAAIMIVMTYRDNEVNEEHPFAKAMQDWKEEEQEQGQEAYESRLAITDIHVEGLTEQDVGSVLQHLLACDVKDETRLLAECVHGKTAGNPFYMKQFLLSLQKDRLLTYNPDSDRWQYDVQQLRTAAKATDNVVALLSAKLQKLPEVVQTILPRVACLGPRFTTATAQIILDKYLKAEERDSILLTCQQEGLLNIEVGGQQETWWAWEHDQLKNAPLLLVGDQEELETIKYEVGELLLKKLPGKELESNHHTTFAIANLLNTRASSLGKESPRRVEIAKLNLRAGEMSMRSSAFNAAVQYLRHGIELLPNGATKWDSHFCLCLELYSAATEAHYCIGDFKQVKELSEEVMALSSCPLIKKCRAYNALVHSFAAQGRMAEAQELVVNVLAKLGCKFPKIGRSVLAMSGIMKVAMTVEKTTTKLGRLKPMKDDEKKWTIYLLDRLASYSYQCDPGLLPLAILKGLDWTVKYGRTEMTSPLLATIALILAGSIGDFAGAKKYADLALKYMTTSVASRTMFLCYHFVMHYQIPTRPCIEHLSQSYETGIKSGDLESAFWSAYCVLEGRLHTGTPLPQLLEDCKTFSLRTASYNQIMIGWSADPVWQLADNLTKNESNQHVLDGSIMKEDEFQKRTNKYAHFGQQFNRIKTSAAFWFDQHELVVQLMEDCGHLKFAIEKATPGANGIGTLYFHCAMSCLALVHRDNKKHQRQKQQAKKFLKKLKGWVNKGNPNVQHYESLLEAELASCSGKPFVVAAKHYDCAIMLAGRMGLLNDYALALERYGDHCSRHGDEEGATTHYDMALESYEKWGAHGKVGLLRTRIIKQSN